MKKIYCLSLLLYANAMFSCEKKNPKELQQNKQEFKESLTQDKKISSFQNEERLESKRPYCKNRQLERDWADFPGFKG